MSKLEWFSTISDFARRHITIIVLTIIILFQVNLDTALVQTIFKTILGFLITIVLSGIAQFSYTKFNFTKEDNPYNPLALAIIYLGTALLVVASALAYYCIEYKPNIPLL